MICDSIEIIKSGDVKRKFSYILVDEFQDISEARAMLIKNLIKDHNETRLFCV
jgi:DNA helicase-4